jgi:hypothetical protein
LSCLLCLLFLSCVCCCRCFCCDEFGIASKPWFQAWREAESSVERSLKRSAEGLPDEAMDDPLRNEVQLSLHSTFRVEHGFDVPLGWMGVDSLLGRLNREMNKHTLVAIKVDKIKTLEKANVLGPQAKKVKLTDDIDLSMGASPESDGSYIRSPFQYVMALQVLMFTMTVAGSYKVSRGSEELFQAPLGLLLGHLASAQSFVTRCSSGRQPFSDADILVAVRKLDGAILQKWAERFRARVIPDITLGEVIRSLEAFSDGLWLNDPVRSQQRPPTGKVGGKGGQGQHDNVHLDKRQPVAEKYSASVKTAKSDKAGAKICKPWNDSRGCDKPNGHDGGTRHVCDVLLPNGQACAQQHMRVHHKGPTVPLK